MKLQSLRLHGFKSFADRTTLEFRDGVTAIIGSNGCGKSNIADAIRWVLGEQRASAMRGAKMEEVIFQGTSRRRPVNLAEVVLVFDNEDGQVPVPQTAIEVARKVFREGGSEYSLNRNVCRRRDITGLLRDTGLGSNAYAIIEAGMIETLLSDRAEERRMLFEEAAGIGRYKDSRQAASRRLEAAEADLARLEDLINEVDAKVRTLARQKRRAERHSDLLARRLDVEVALATHELETLSGELRASEERRAELDELRRSAGTERTTAEAVVEERRLETSRLAGERAAVTARLEAVRRELDANERELLLADERRTHGEQRLQQLIRERSELTERQASLARELERSGEARDRHFAALHDVREQLESQVERNQLLRAQLAREREVSESAAARAAELAREIATSEGERAAAERRRREAEEQLASLAEQERSLSSALTNLSEQTELWAVRGDEVHERIASATQRLEIAREELTMLRRREQTARDAYRTAEEEATRLAAQVAARAGLERGYEGFSPAVAAIMSRRERFEGVHGPLADFIDGTNPEEATGVETFLGPLLQALVVDRVATARRVRDWFRSEWDEGGSLILLPLDALHDVTDAGPADWLKVLLGGLEVISGDPLNEMAAGISRVSVSGDVVDARGVVRLPEGGAGEGILARREALARMRLELTSAEAERDQKARSAADAREALDEAEEVVREAEESRRAFEAEARRVELDSAAHHHQHGRLQQDRQTLEQTLISLRQTIDASTAQMSELERRLEILAGQVDASGEEDVAARGRLSELQGDWEEARDRESELRIAVARAESDLRETERRLGSADRARADATARLEAIDREADQVRSTLEELSATRSRASSEIDRLFSVRDAEAANVSLLDARLAELDSDLAELGERIRVARRRENESSEERHALDLEIAESRSRIERTRERLEVEWAKPWEALAASATPVVDGTPEEWRTALRDIIRQIEGVGPVNMLAVEEHAEEERRLIFLKEQRDDLVRARDDLANAIRQINRTAREVFMGTFTAVRENFLRVFQSLFHGGECDLWLADPDDPLESPIEIQASPKGKRTQRLHLLSGGERTLTALALLFALYLVKPSPFCVLDEVDAPLDETNVARFIQLLQDFKQETQFIVITHNPRTMEAADWVYGVTMEEPGVSTIVGVEMLGSWTSGGAVAVNT